MAPYRPTVDLALVIEFQYAYAAIAIKTGRLDYIIATKMNTENMSKFLHQVSHSHWNKIIIMIVDGTVSHKSKGFIIHKNISLIFLP